MITECRKYDVPEPVFSEMETDFRVEFFRKALSDTQKTTQKTITVLKTPEITTTEETAITTEEKIIEESWNY